MINLGGLVEPKPFPNSPPTTTVFSATPEQARDFFDPPPDQIFITGYGVINPYYQMASLSAEDFFLGQLTISSPFALAIDDTIIFSPEISGVAVNDARPEGLGERIFDGSLRAILENRLPLGVSVRLFLGNRSDSSLYTDSSSLALGPYDMAAAMVGQPGTPPQPTTSFVDDTIDNSHLWLFEGDSIFVGQVIRLLPTDTAGVIINGSDYVGVRANAMMKIKIGD